MGSAALFTAFLTTYCVGNLIGSALAKPLTDWKCKVSVFWWTNALGGAQRGDVLRTDGRRNHHVRLYLHHWRTAPAGDANPVVMMSDTVDYGEWCNGKRLTGISFAGTLFVLKLGLALGGALIGWMLAGGGMTPPLKPRTAPPSPSLSPCSPSFRRCATC